MDLFELPPGRRAILSGSTGSGKSTLACRYMSASSFHWVVFNPKGSRVYDRLGGKKLALIDERRIEKSLHDNQYTILNFSYDWGMQRQDILLLWLCNRYENIGICVDELYTLHRRGISGPGLDGLITRGRELGQSFIGCTQRPRFVSNFCYSEADTIITFHLQIPDDRKKVYENTGIAAALENYTGHDFLYFDVASGRATVYRA